MMRQIKKIYLYEATFVLKSFWYINLSIKFGKNLHEFEKYEDSDFS